MEKYLQFPVIAVLVLGLTACQHKAQSGNNEEADFPEFLQKFKSFQVPYSITEDSLTSQLADSNALVYKKYSQLIPDSVWHPGGKNKPNAKIFPLGKSKYGTLQLLLARTVYGSSDKVLLWVYGKNDSLKASHQLMERSRSVEDKMSLDKNYLLHLSEKKRLADGEVIRREQVYGINDDGSLGLIMTNTNEPANPDNFYNPIDTLPFKHHYSGNYSSGKSDVVSIRDGDKEGTFRFFIHLYKNKGDCTGEIDGIGKFEHNSVGIFKEESGPCAIRFNFAKNKVTIEEVGGCGAYRGISCNFSGTYTKEKKSK